MLILALFLAATSSLLMTPVETFISRLVPQAPEATASATIGSLPPGWLAPVPMPAGTPVLGSVRSAGGVVDVYYQPVDAHAAYTEYAHVLRAAGFIAKPLNGPFATGGFVQSTAVPALSMFCNGAQPVRVLVPPNSRDDLRVSVESATGPFNACTGIPERDAFAQANRLPQIRVPAGITMSAEQGGGSSMSVSAEGASAHTEAAALLSGNTGVQQLMASFGAQMRQAGWIVGSSAISASAGVASFTHAFDGQTWVGTLTVYRGQLPHAFHAVLAASGNPTLVHPSSSAQPALPQLPTRIAKSQEPLLLQLMQRMLEDERHSSAAIALRKPPQRFPATVPLPHGDLIGSTSVTSRDPNLGFATTDTLYYDLTQMQLEQYTTKMTAAGWRGQAAFPPRNDGFVSDEDSRPMTFCKSGAPGITLVPAAHNSAVTVIVDRGREPNECTASWQLESPTSQLPRVGLPSPAIQGWSTNGDGTAATFQTTQSPAPLLDAIAAQIIAQGWSAVSRIANETLATQSFSRANAKRGAMQLALTIYRTAPASNSYAATMNVTPTP